MSFRERLLKSDDLERRAVGRDIQWIATEDFKAREDEALDAMQAVVNRRFDANRGGHHPGDVHRLSDGTTYHVMPDGSWARIDGPKSARSDR